MSDLVYFICSFIVSMVFGLVCADSYAFGNYINLTLAIWSIANAYYYYSLSSIFSIESDYEKRRFITELTRFYLDSPLLSIAVAGIITYCIKTNHILLQSDDIQLLFYVHLNLILNQFPQTLTYSILYIIVESALLIYLWSCNNFLKRTIDSALKIIVTRLTLTYFFENFNYDYIMTNIVLNLSEPIALVFLFIFISDRSFKLMISLYEENRLLLQDKSFAKVSSGYLYYFYYGKEKVLRHLSLLLLTFIIPFIAYYIAISIFNDFHYLIKLYAVQEFAQPFSYLLLMNSDHLSLKSIQINRCTVFFLWLVASPFIPLA